MPVGYTPQLAVISASTTFYTTASFTPPAGQYVIASNYNNATAMTISDSLSGSWVQVGNVVVGSRNMFLWLRTTVSNGSAMTISFFSTTGSVSHRVTIGSLTGYSRTPTYSGTTSNTGTTTFSSLTTPSAVGVGDLIMVWGGAITTVAPTFTAGSGFTIGNQASAATSGTFNQYRVATASGTVTSTATSSTATTVTAQVSAVFYDEANFFTGWGAPI